MNETRFVINYLLNNQPKSIEIKARAKTIAPEQTRDYLEALHAVKKSDRLTNIQIVGSRPDRPDAQRMNILERH